MSDFIEHNGHLAGSYICKLWSDIEDLIGEDDTKWPADIRKIFWMKDIGHVARLKIVTFSAVNGLPPHKLTEWLMKFGCIDGIDKDACFHMDWLIDQCYHAAIYKNYWFGYNVTSRRL